MTRALLAGIAASALAVSACETPAPAQGPAPLNVSALDQPDRAPDGRRILYLDPAQRMHVSAQMRGFLIGVQQVSEGLAQEDRKKIATAAAAMGPGHGGGPGGGPGQQGQGRGAGAGDGAQGVMAGMPPEFHAMGRSLHMGFADVATMAGTAEMSEIQAAFAANIAKCSACHSTFAARDAK